MKDHEQRDDLSFGFQIFSRKMKLKLDLDAAGADGLTSFLAACIASGVNHEEDILNEVSDITGLHCELLVRLLLMEGENIHWAKTGESTFAPLAQS